METSKSAGVHPKVGVVTGLASEAVVAAALAGEDSLPVSVVCAGASAARAAALARDLVEQGVEAVLSFGIAGALDPTLETGTVIVADHIFVDVDNDARIYPCDADWQEALRAALAEAQLPCRCGRLLGSRRLWRDARDKAALFARTGSLAVDMESGTAASVVAEAGLPFLAVRVVADRAQDSLPALVETAVKPDGMPAVGRTIGALIRNPAQLPGMLRLARQSAAALSRLRRLDAVRDALFGGF